MELLQPQLDFLRSATPETLYSGAFGAGKSLALALKIDYHLCKWPNNQGLLLRATMKSLEATTLQLVLHGDAEAGYGGLLAIGAEHNQNRNTITLPNGSVLRYGGMDMSVDRTWFNSLNLAFAAIDQAEELTLDQWQLIKGRLRNKAQRYPDRRVVTNLFAACNPGGPSHFLYDRFFTNRIPKRRVIVTKTSDNWHLPECYIEQLDSYTGIFRQRYVEGKWVAAEGIIYDTWSPSNVVEAFPIPPDWPRYRAIDFGFHDPFVCLWAARGGDTWYVYRQLYMTRKIVADHAKIIKEAERGEPISNSYADHDAEGRETLDQAGIPTNAATKEVITGIQATYDVIATGKLKIFRNCVVERDQSLRQQGRPTSLEEELAVYRWRETGTKEKPADGNDHACDALRYLIASLASGVGVSFSKAGAFARPGTIRQHSMIANVSEQRRRR